MPQGNNPGSDWLNAHPALGHFLLAVVLGMAPISLVATGVLSPGFNQLGALSGSAAGLLLAWYLGGRPELVGLLKRGAIWRMHPGWWAFVLLVPGVITLAALYLGQAVGGAAVTFDAVGGVGRLLGLLAFLIVFAGVGEEFGWRGFVLPRVQAVHSALAASLIVGVLHALWHTPLFFIPGVTQYEMAQQAGLVEAFLGNTILILVLGVQMAWIFNHTRGSVLMVAAYHGSVNAWNGYLDVYRGQMAGVWSYLAIVVVGTVVIVWHGGARALSRTHEPVCQQSRSG